jgi:hypothetical protein
VQRQPGLRQPLLEVGDARRIVVVDVRSRRAQFDGLESRRGDF